jgi:CBS domain-containing protein
MACGDALALAVAHRRSFTASDFRQRHPGGSLGAMLRPVEELVRFRPGENLTTTSIDVPLVEALRQSAEDHAGTVRHAGAVLVLDEQERLVAEYRIDEIPVVDEQGRAVGLIDIQDLVAPRVVVD